MQRSRAYDPPTYVPSQFSSRVDSLHEPNRSIPSLCRTRTHPSRPLNCTTSLASRPSSPVVCFSTSVRGVLAMLTAGRCHGHRPYDHPSTCRERRDGVHHWSARGCAANHRGEVWREWNDHSVCAVYFRQQSGRETHAECRMPADITSRDEVIRLAKKIGEKEHEGIHILVSMTSTTRRPSFTISIGEQCRRRKGKINDRVLSSRCA
jgi:hypothetical protein